jgi:hypothetical protein
MKETGQVEAHDPGAVRSPLYPAVVLNLSNVPEQTKQFELKLEFWQVKQLE